MSLPTPILRLLDPHVSPATKLLMLFGLSYPLQPIDLIPDRLPYVGHADNYGLPVAGAAAALLLLLGIPGRAVVLARLTRAGLGILASIGQAAAARAPGRFILRLMLGRWPDPPEQQAFLAGLAATGHSLPPLLRAAAYVPAAAPLLGRGMLLSAVTGQRSRPGDGRPVVAGNAGIALSDAQMRGNLLAVWRGPKLRFLHLEKTAGSSLVVALQSQFHPLQIHSEGALKTITAIDAERFAALAAAHRRAEFVWGHYDLPSLRRLDGDEAGFHFCLLRDPRQRILSLYYFWRATSGATERPVCLAREHGLLDFLRLRDPALRNEIDNLYVRRLTGLYVTGTGDPLDAAPDQALAAAERAMRRLDFVGISERLTESLALLGDTLGFTPPARTPAVNVQAQLELKALRPTPASPREPMTEAIEAELAALTRLDIMLYRSADRRLARLRPGTGAEIDA
ncbi:DUF1232 domain-containing protein [Lichenicoccus roseus]|nr:DUF1232 domain-containing protein [Lichenicoccus roseus]